MKHVLPVLSLGVLTMIACGSDAEPDANTSSSASGGSSSGAGASSSSSSSSSGGSSSGDAATGLTVQGRVSSWGRNLPGVQVVIGDHGVQTDENGSFTLAGVVAPYTASVIVPPELSDEDTPGAPRITVYAGLTTPTPVLPVRGKFEFSNGTVHGTLAGGATFPNANVATYVVQPEAVSTYPVEGGGGYVGNPSFPKDFTVQARWPLGQTKHRGHDDQATGSHRARRALETRCILHVVGGVQRTTDHARHARRRGLGDPRALPGLRQQQRAHVLRALT